MPLADYTAIANLALDHLGEPYLTAYETDTTVAAQAARLHLPQCIETVLEGHVWSFATRCQQVTSAPVTVATASATLDPAGDNNAILFTAVQAGPAGNDISITIAEASETSSETIVSVNGNAITITPPALFARLIISGTMNPAASGELITAGVPPINGQGIEAYSTDGTHTPSATGRWNYLFWSPADAIQYRTYLDGVQEGMWYSLDGGSGDTPTIDIWTAETWEPFSPATGAPVITTEIDNAASFAIDAINDSASASLLVTAANAGFSDGSGTIAAVSATNLSGGSSTSSVYAPAYGSAFNLPSDCLRVIKLDGADIDVPLNRWEIQGRHLLLEEAEADAPVIHYITNAPPVDEWPTTFTDAVAFLLAARLAPKLAQDQSLAADFLQKHEMALGKARSKDSRETRSKENFGPRHLAARSGLVRARYGNPRPPY